jgi:hypothetical protein
MADTEKPRKPRKKDIIQRQANIQAIGEFCHKLGFTLDLTAPSHCEALDWLLRVLPLNENHLPEDTHFVRDLDTRQFLNEASGRLCLGIGRGDFRAELSSIIMEVSQASYTRGRESK